LTNSRLPWLPTDLEARYFGGLLEIVTASRMPAAITIAML